MFFKSQRPKKQTFAFVTFMAFLAVSCTNQKTASHADNLASLPDSTSTYCEPESQNVKLDLAGVSLEREPNIPLEYQGFNNIEGPVWYDGALYYSNMGSHHPDRNGFELTNQATIWRWVPGETPQVWMDDTIAGTNGLAVDSQGRLVAARQLDGSLSYIDWKTKAITPIVTTYKDKRFNAPNDLTIGQDGTIYFTDPNWNTPSNIVPTDVQGGGPPGSLDEGQRIYRVTSEGKINATSATDLVPELRDKPNGIILSLDEQQLVIGGLRGLWAFDLNAGKLSNPSQLLDTPIDGLGKDCSGNIYVTTTRVLPPRTDSQIIVVLDKNHKEIGVLNVPGIHIVTNIAFGGRNGKTLFATSLTAPMEGEKPRLCGNAPCLKAGIYTAKLNVQGFPY